LKKPCDFLDKLALFGKKHPSLRMVEVGLFLRSEFFPLPHFFAGEVAWRNCRSWLRVNCDKRVRVLRTPPLPRETHVFAHEFGFVW
jgi:hypothetical protein